MSRVLRNLHFGFTVSDIQRTMAFFRDCMGFEIERRGRDPMEITSQFVGVPGGDLEYCVIKAPDHTIEIMQYYGPADRRRLNSRPCDVGYSHLSYQVEDVDAFIAKAAKYDVVPVNRPMNFPDYRVRGIYMRDPDGLGIEIIQDLPSS